jgi:hypothetical protein
MYIQAAQPFDFRKTLALAGAASVIELTVDLDGASVLACVREAPGGVEVTVTSPISLDDVHLAAVRDYVSNHLCLGDELAGFYRRAKSDRAFAPLLRHGYGLHQVKAAQRCDQTCCLDTARAIYGHADAVTMNTLASLYGEYADYWHFYLKAVPALTSSEVA